MAAIKLVPASEKRAQLGISIDTGIGYVSDSAGAGPAQGFVITPNSPLWLDRLASGDILSHAWYGSATLNTAQWGLIEIEEAK